MKGVIAGNWDVIHPGYIKGFKECKEYCKELIVLLHTDPSIERENKLKPVLSVEERREILSEIRSIDSIIEYTYEWELVERLKEIKPDIRFLGDDYKGKTYTGFELNIPIHYLNREHGWSATLYKRLIKDSVSKNES